MYANKNTSGKLKYKNPSHVCPITPYGLKRKKYSKSGAILPNIRAVTEICLEYFLQKEELLLDVQM